jgi:hypothetical protein
LESTKTIQVSAILLLGSSCSTIPYWDSPLLLLGRQWVRIVDIGLDRFRCPHTARNKGQYLHLSLPK